ncbi:MAG: sigma-70 family RNA polymerase sigma factor [Bacillati bacterium ANGP1]|uniref:Sigma-70 family RNA polymerase sigma factor n=1 Tax=Candidatus Segetimicrobium genomatis TaxID=2569760 RepID=A0A537J0Q9_9BACT|nr:MAG: sigma-70 family RNA polymerase sigma factor [Terrabacteria group bacterium ANGP1]
MTRSNTPPRYNRDEIAAFEALVGRYGQRVYTMAYRMAGNDADAKDLAQEAFLRVFRAWRSIDPSAHLDSWLYRIVTNLFIDMLRRRPRVRMESLDAPVTARSGGEMVREIADDRAGPEADVVDQQMEADVQRALVALHHDLRAVVLLSDIEGYAYEEIAETLGIPVGTVKSRLHRARKTLQARLSHLASHRLEKIP